MKKGRTSPWAWVPSLYFAEGLPYVAVMTMAVILYKRLGMSNTDIALYTSWLYLPWTIKPLWSPFVDLLRTKRWWIVGMQSLLGAALAGIAFFIPTSFYVQATLACFWLMAFASATHDIAADGFYLLGLDEKAQSLFVGIRNTFYRLATIFGQGVLVMMAGWMETAWGNGNARSASCVPCFATKRTKSFMQQSIRVGLCHSRSDGQTAAAKTTPTRSTWAKTTNISNNLQKHTPAKLSTISFSVTDTSCSTSPLAKKAA